MPNEEMGVKNTTEATPAQSSDATNTNVAENSDVNKGQVASSSQGDVKPQSPKTYTEEEINKIIHERTKSYSEKIKQYEEMLKSKKDDAEPKKNTEYTLTEEDKQFIEYYKKIRPHLETIDLKKEDLDFISSLRAREQAENNRFLSEGEKTIKSLASEMKIPEDKVEILKESIASIILNNDDLKSKLTLRDTSVFKEAFEIFKGTFANLVNSSAKEKVENVVKTKEQVASIKQPVKGGIPGSLTKKEKMTDDEFLEAAFKRVSGGS